MRYVVSIIFLCSTLEVMAQSHSVRHFPAQKLSGAPVDPNPIDPWAGTYAGHWKMFETNSVGAFIDYSGNAGTGILTSIVVADGKYTNTFGQVGAGNNTDGSDDCVTIADKDVLSLTTNGIDNKFTIALSFRKDANNASGYDSLVAKDNYTTDQNEEYWVMCEGGTITMWLFDKTSSSRNKYVRFKSLAGTFNLITNQISLVFSYGGQTNCELYSVFNSASQYTPTNMTRFNLSTTVVSYTCMTNRAATLKLGRLGGSTLYSFNGEFHDVSEIPGTNWSQAQAQAWLEKVYWTNHLLKMTQ